MDNSGIRFAAKVFTAILLSVFCLSSKGFAEQETGEIDLSLGELLNLEKYLVTATKHRIEVKKAPAIATVINQEEIRNMGARTVNDVLRRIPGFSTYTLASTVGDSFVSVRGTPAHIGGLFLIDGHRTNNGYVGRWGDVFGDLKVDNIKRIEIVRGPGSALYGANAFVAVINVITKSAEDIGGQEISISSASFDTQHYSALLSHKGDRFQISGHADYFDTDGPALLVEEDALTPRGTGLAPGNTLSWKEKYDFGLRIKYGDFSFNSRGVYSEKGPYIGALEALNDETVAKYTQVLGDLIYTKNLTEELDIKVNLYADHYHQDVFIELFPEGFTGKNDKGYMGNPIVRNTTMGNEITANYVAGDHYLTGGFAYEEVRQYDVESYNNFGDVFAEPVKIDELFIKEVTRKIWAVYLQNIWEITAYDSLTLGVRHDNYSDFGGTTNPRIGYVHEFRNGMIMKLLYGSAFRAPSFAQLYVINNPSVLGNPELNPEKINTYEMGLEYPLLKYCTLRLNYFHNDIEDLITIGPKPSLDDPAPYINVHGKTRVDGFESELDFYFGKGKYGYINYSYQYGKDENDKVLPFFAHWKANAGLNYPLFRYLNANLNVSWKGKRPRNKGDPRDDLSAMTLVDLTLIAKDFYKNFEIRGSVYNLFDKDYRDPSWSTKMTVPNDYPLNPRSFVAEVRYKF